MTKILACLIGLTILTACNHQVDDTFICGEYTVKIDTKNDGMILDAIINDNAVTMNIAMSGSGARYVGDLDSSELVLWNKGEDWTLFVDDSEPIECRTKKSK